MRGRGGAAHENESISVILVHWFELADHNDFPSQIFHNGGKQLFPLKRLKDRIKMLLGTCVLKHGIFVGLLIPLLSCNPIGFFKSIKFEENSKFIKYRK